MIVEFTFRSDDRFEYLNKKNSSKHRSEPFYIISLQIYRNLYQNHFAAENIKCYSIPKATEDDNLSYLKKVEKCFDEWKENSKLPFDKLKKMALLHIDLKVKSSFMKCYGIKNYKSKAIKEETFIVII